MTEFLENHRNKISLALLAILAAGTVLWLERRPTTREIAIVTPVPASAATSRWLTVDVAGAVARPGVYSLRDGSRVSDAIQAAGGEASDADLSRVNRAARLRDEQQVIVPRLRATPEANASPAVPVGQALVDINVASGPDLEKLPGIGEITAQRIVSYREQFGPFARVEQLKEAKLVSASTFDKIKDLLVAR